VLTQDFQDIWRTLQASAMPGTIFFVAFCSLHCVPLGVCVCVCVCLRVSTRTSQRLCVCHWLESGHRVNV